MTGLVHDLLDHQLATRPDATALRRQQMTWSYRELARRSAVCASWLRAQGVRRGDRVLVNAPHEPDTVAAVYAASRLGGLYVVISDQAPPARIRQIVADCQPRVLLGTADTLTAVPPGLGPVVATFAEVAAWTGEVPGASDSAVPVDAVSLIYTSGSTSVPKAVVSTHRQVRFAAEAIHSRLCYRPTDVIFCCLPLSFDYGLYQVLLGSLAGAQVVLADAADAGPALHANLDRFRATVLPLVPSLAANLIALIRRSGRSPAHLRLITSSGAALAPTTANELRELIRGLDLVTMFGLTECKRVSVMEPNGDLARPGSVGRPLPGTEVLILDEYGDPLPPGQVGELVVRGEHVMAGYWRSPELTAQRFRRDDFGQPLLFTGDRCRLDEDGYLYFAGRVDDIYKQRGFRVSAAEVVAAALDIPSVAQAAVLLPTDTRDSVLAVSGPADSANALDGNEVLRELRTRIEPQKCPPTCVVLACLPVTSNGKVDHRALAAALEPACGLTP